MPKRDPDEQRRFRMHVWKHNSFAGHVRMAISNMQTISKSRSTTPATKKIAEDIIEKLYALGINLSERNDDDF